MSGSSLFSREGRNLLISSGNSVQLYSVETGALLATLCGHTAPICGLMHHPVKQRSALSGSIDGTIREWDFETGACLGVINIGAPIVKVCSTSLPKGCASNIFVVVSLGAMTTNTSAINNSTLLSTEKQQQSVTSSSSLLLSTVEQNLPMSPEEEEAFGNKNSTKSSSRRRPAPSSTSTPVSSSSAQNQSSRKVARTSTSSISISSALKNLTSKADSNASAIMVDDDIEIENTQTITDGSSKRVTEALITNMDAHFLEAYTYPLGNEIACVQTSPPTFAIATALTIDGKRRHEPWSFVLEINLDLIRISRVILSARGFPTGLTAKCFGVSTLSSSSTTSTMPLADIVMVFSIKKSVYVLRGNFLTRYSSKSIISCISLHPFDNLLSVGEIRGPISTWILDELSNDFKFKQQTQIVSGNKSTSSSSSPPQFILASDSKIDVYLSSSLSHPVFSFAQSGSALSFPPTSSSPTIITGGSSFRSSDVHWHSHAPWALSFSNDGSFLFSGGEEGALVLWQLQAVGSGSASGPVKDKKTMTFVPRLGAPIRSISTFSSGALLPFEMGVMDIVDDISETTTSVGSSLRVESTAVVASPINTTLSSSSSSSSSMHIRNAPPVMYAVTLVDNSVVVINGLTLRTMWRASRLSIAGLPASIPRGVAIYTAAAALLKLNSKGNIDTLKENESSNETTHEKSSSQQVGLKTRGVSSSSSSSFFSSQLPSSIYHTFSRHLLLGVVPDPRTRGVLVNGFPGKGTLQLLDVARGVAHLQIDVAQRNFISRSNDEPPPPVRVTHAALSPDGLHLATVEVTSSVDPGANEGNTLKFWSWIKDSTAGEFVLITRVDSPHKAEVTVLEFHPFEALVVSGSRDRTFKQWQREAVLVSNASAAGKGLHLQPHQNVKEKGDKSQALLNTYDRSGLNRKERRQSKHAGVPMPSTLSEALASKQPSTTTSTLPIPPASSAPPQAPPRYMWICLSAGFYRDFPVTSGAFSLDGSVLALAFGHTITLWSPRSNALKRTLSHVVDSIEEAKNNNVEGVIPSSERETGDNDDDVFGDGDSSYAIGNPNGRVNSYMSKGNRLLVSATRYPNVIRVAFLGASSLLVSATKHSIVVWDLLLCAQVYAFDAAVVSLAVDRLGSSSSTRFAVVIENKDKIENKKDKNMTLSSLQDRYPKKTFDCVLFEGSSPVPISAWHLASTSSHAGTTTNFVNSVNTLVQDSKFLSNIGAIPEPPLYAVSFLSPAALSATTATPYFSATESLSLAAISGGVTSSVTSSVTPLNTISTPTSLSASTGSGVSGSGGSGIGIAGSSPHTPANGILVLGPLNEVYTLLTPPHSLSRLQGPIAANAATAASTIQVTSGQTVISASTSSKTTSNTSTTSASLPVSILPKNMTSNGLVGLSSSKSSSSSSSSQSSQLQSTSNVFGSSTTSQKGDDEGAIVMDNRAHESLQSALSRFGTVAAVHSPSFLFEGLIDSLLQPQVLSSTSQQTSMIPTSSQHQSVSSSNTLSSEGPYEISSTGSSVAVHEGLVTLFSSILEEENK
jgi:hypothetical protein